MNNKKLARSSIYLFSIVPFVILILIAFIIIISTSGKILKKASDGNERVDAEDSAYQLPSFPGAEGFGSQTIGGRGGKVIEVTNLNASGPGSFKAAIEEKGPRIVVFKVGGTIRSNNHFVIRNPYITIAGQTAPGDGIMIRGAGLKIATHDVIVRGMRFRVGDDPNGPDSTSRDSLNISSFGMDEEIYNVIIDHSSFSWGVDENTSVWGDKSSDVTLSWNIISEGLHCSIHIDEGTDKPNCHSMGLLAGNLGKNISIHHNLFAHNRGRNPRFVALNGEIINNVVYNWGTEAVIVSKPNTSGSVTQKVDVIGNYFIPGADTRTASPQNRGIRITDSVSDNSRIYVKGNIGPNRLDTSSAEWNAVYEENTRSVYKSQNPVSASNIKVLNANDSLERVTEKAGAYLPKRDSVDVRIINDLKNKTGSVIDSQGEVGGWPVLRNGTSPIDRDHDGMPDEWESQNGLNSRNASDASETSPSGYTWIEEYINSFYGIPSTQTKELISNLNIRDRENDDNWKLLESIKKGDQAYGDRDYKISSLPGFINRVAWIRTAAESKKYTRNPLVTFKVTKDTVVYVAHDVRINPKPSWLRNYRDTKEDIVIDQTNPGTNVPTTFRVYSKNFSKGQTVSLGNNGDTSDLMYFIFVKER